MKILIKATFKNIIGKPFRSLLVIFSIFACSMAAMLCFDLAGSMEYVFADLTGGIAGNADLSITGKEFSLDKLPEDFPEYDVVKYSQSSEKLYKNVEGEYYISSSESASVYGVDTLAASEMNLIANYELGDGEALVTEPFANTYGCKEGDKITLHDAKDNPVEVTVKMVEPELFSSYFLFGSVVILNDNTAEKLSCGRPLDYQYMIDIKDDTFVSSAENMLHDAFPKAEVGNYHMSESSQQQSHEMAGFMFLVFVIAFLLVIFITSSISERIVSERMSYVGTLRSLGLSAKATGLILLLENVFYAILGSVPAVVLYCIGRSIFVKKMFVKVDIEGNLYIADHPKLSMALVIGTVAGAILIECIIPLRAQLRTLKISIRDIIFDNRDTEYKFSKSGITFGVIMSVLAVVMFFLKSNIIAAALCLIFGVTALAFLFPIILKRITAFLENVTRKADKEKWALASSGAGRRKSAVSSGVLSVTSAAMCVIVFSVAMSFMGLMKSNIYDADVIVNTSNSSEYYSFVNHLDGVTDSELIYKSSPQVTLSGQEVVPNFYGVPEGGFKMFDAFDKIPDKIEDGTVAVENSWAMNRGYSVGDTLDLVVDPNGVFPIKKSFTIKGLFKNKGGTTNNDTILISMNDYNELFHDTPSSLLIRSDNPEETAETIEKYAVGTFYDVKTKQEMVNEDKHASSKIIKIFGLTVLMALGMTCIGMTSNQLIGFEGRRKECAVMLSTAMSKKTLSGVLLREMIITAMTSATLGVLIGSALVFVIKAALASTQALYLPVKVDPVLLISMWAGMTLIFVLTVLFPIKNLRKMKIAEQIKYE